jgi:adenosylcobinamide-phosphate synthase
MAALALALGVRLGKPGVYLLNPTAPSPASAQVRSALRRAQLAGLALAMLPAAMALLPAGLELAHG